VRLYRAPGHFELPRNLRIVTTLKQQFRNLLLAWAQPNGALLHSNSPGSLIQARVGRLFEQK
jgi:hypothetical protein